MDPITHLAHKLAAERARQAVHRTDPIPETAPPPYTAEEEDDSDAESDSDSDTDDADDSPVRLTINAATSLHGSNNLVSTSPSSPLSDATKFSALLLHAVNRINQASDPKAPRRRMKVDLTINCGLTIVGDRNVVGHVGLRPKAAPAPGTLVRRVVDGERGAVAGAKRRAEESSDEEPRQKRRMVTADELDAPPSRS